MNTLSPAEQSGASAAARAHFETALGAFQTYLGDPLAPIEAALADDPEFVMGHLFRAAALHLTTERRFQHGARVSLETAEALIGRASPRERAFTRALRSLIDGDWDRACRDFDALLVEHPTDVFALQVAHLMDFLRGDAHNLRNRIARVLPHWSPSMPGYSFVLGMYAFGLEECNQYPEAERAGRTALAIEPRDAWAVHAVAHVMEMQGRTTEGIEWLELRRRDWAPEQGPANGFAYHNWWHLALFHLDRGDAERALAIVDESILPEVGDLSMALLDVSALLWRLTLLDVPLGNRWSEHAAAWERKLDEELGFSAFNDFHAALAFAAAGRSEALARVAEAQARAAVDAVGSNRAMAEHVSVPLVGALTDYVEGRFGAAAETLVGVRDGAARFGGSHAQRDLITLTLIDAARRAGDLRLARHYLNERLSSRAQGGLGWQLLARLGVAPRG